MNSPNAKNWLVHIAPEWKDYWVQNCLPAPATKVNVFSSHFAEVSFADDIPMSALSESIFPRFIMPVQYLWPVDLNGPSFIEKAAQGLLRKFSAEAISNVQVFAVDEGFKTLGSNLRGRLLQVFADKLKSESGFAGWRNDPASAPAQKNGLVVALKKNTVLAGIVSPRLSKSFFAGGRRFLAASNDEAISRASAKFVEAAEHFRLFGIDVLKKNHWIELGAAPGGMSQELLQRGFTVLAVDRADLEPALVKHPRMRFVQEDAATFALPNAADAILCDMNGSAESAAAAVVRASQVLKSKDPIIFTLKIVEPEKTFELVQKVGAIFEKAGLSIVSKTHLYHNRQEMTFCMLK